MTFNHIERTGLTQKQVITRAKEIKCEMEKRFGKGSYSLQEAIDGVIDAAAEFAQG